MNLKDLAEIITNKTLIKKIEINQDFLFIPAPNSNLEGIKIYLADNNINLGIAKWFFTHFDENNEIDDLIKFINDFCSDKIVFFIKNNYLASGFVPLEEIEDELLAFENKKIDFLLYSQFDTNFYLWTKPIEVYELWKSDADAIEYSFFPRRNKFDHALTSDAKLIKIFVASSWDEACQKKDKYLHFK